MDALGARRVTLEELLKESDFVSVHVPLTEGTRHLISRRELGLMKRTAVLVNTARGPVVDEGGWWRRCGKKKIFAAGLDVYEREPVVEEEVVVWAGECGDVAACDWGRHDGGGAGGEGGVGGEESGGDVGGGAAAESGESRSMGMRPRISIRG